MNTAAILLVFDLLGTFVFALQGAIAAVSSHLDPVGMAVLAFVTACGGGIVRDLLIGAVPPATVRDWRYAATAFVAATVVFLAPTAAQQLPRIGLLALDAAGLALFAVAGTLKGLDYRLNPLLAVLLGTITGVGGGTMRDVLLARVPIVLYTDVYATAAACGAALTAIALRLGVRPAGAGLAGGIACFALRMVAATQGWQLPRALAF